MKTLRQLISFLCLVIAMSSVSHSAAQATSSYHLKQEEEKMPETILQEIQPKTDVYFGVYEQDNNLENGPEALPWSVLDRNGDKVLLITSQIIDIGPYGSYAEPGEIINWANSYLREWMNGDFISKAFSEDMEASLISTESKSLSGSVSDKVFALSISEAREYFYIHDYYTDSRYHTKTSDYALSRAKQEGREIIDVESPYFNNEFIEWWMRTDKVLTEKEAHMSGHKKSTFSIDLKDVTYVIGGYRPAVWVDLIMVGDTIKIIE